MKGDRGGRKFVFGGYPAKVIKAAKVIKGGFKFLVLVIASGVPAKFNLGGSVIAELCHFFPSEVGLGVW